MCLFCFALPASAQETRSQQSGWELSIANGMLLFKQESKREVRPLVEDNTAPVDISRDEPLKDNPESLFLLATDTVFRTEVSGIVARSTLLQTFKNPGDSWLQGQYQFPLPENAAVDSLIMRIGKREIIGRIEEKKQAQKQFEQARQAGKKAALVSQQRPNLFTTAVANIAPYEEIEIEIQFQQQVRFVDGEFRLRLPTTIIPRFGGSTAAETGLPDVSGNMPALDFNLRLNAGTNLDYLHSPHFNVSQEKGAEHTYHIQSEPGQLPNKDIEINWKLANTQPELLHYREYREGAEYGMLMLVPGLKAPQQPIARDITLVIDTSSSMGGQAIKQAKSALLTAIAQLTELDSFNIVQFNSYAASLWPTLLPATKHNRDSASRYVEQLDAEGGTNVYAALDTALSVQRTTDTLQQLVFITDGAIGYEDGLLTRLRQELGDIRLFTVGIGAAPNSYFMVQAANSGRGSYTYIGQQEQIFSRMQALFQKLAYPVLNDININFDIPVEMYPQKLPDLYQGEPLVVSYKSDTAVSDIQLSAQSGNQSWQQNSYLDYTGDHAGTAKYWAGKKIEHLLRKQRLQTSANTEQATKLQQQIVATALSHQLVSPYTSLVAIDTESSRYGNVNSRLIANLPATALGSEKHFYVALVLLLIAALLTFWHATESTGLPKRGSQYV